MNHISFSSIIKIFTAFLIMLSATSCSDTDKVQMGPYSVEVPSTMVETRELKPGAEIQYQDLINNFFIVISVNNKDSLIDSLGTEDLPQMYKYVLDDLRKLGTETYASPMDSINIQGMPGITAEFLRTTDGPEVYSKLTLLKDSTNVYEISLWTLSSQKHEYKPVMEGIISSIKKN